jgi:hypothetical protein
VTITSNLTEEELARPMADGWTVAAKLIHLTFWDRYYLALVEDWERSGFTPFSSNADALNESVLVLSRAIPPKAAVQLIQAAAEAIDQKIAGLSPELASAIEAGGHPRLLRRFLHRREHLDEIEGFLAKRR